MRKHFFVPVCILMILLSAVLCACGAKAPPGTGAPGMPGTTKTEQTVPVGTAVPNTDPFQAEEETEAGPFILEPEPRARLYLSALCAWHEGFKTVYSQEDALKILYETQLHSTVSENNAEEIRRSAISAFSDNGHAMVLEFADGGMSQSYYHVYFTEDYGETWRVYAHELHATGRIEGLLSDGKDYWAYGYADVILDSTLTYLTDHMTKMPEQISMRPFIAPEYSNADAPSLEFADVSLDPEAQLLCAEVEAMDGGFFDGDREVLAAYTLKFHRDLTLYSLEAHE